MPVDSQLASLLGLIAGGTPMSQLSPDEARTAFRKLTVDFRDPSTVQAVREVRDLSVAGAEATLPARVYVPDADGPHPVVVLFHGGGCVVGDLDTHDPMARALCHGVDAIVVSVAYRLAPEHPYPAAVEDAIAATRDVQERTAELGGNGVVAVAGDSAGGNLAAVVTQTVPGLSGQLLIYPATDMTGLHPSMTENAEGYFLDLDTIAWFHRQYLADGGDPADPRLSPLHGDLAGLPPAVVVTAEYDPLRDAGNAYAEALIAAGTKVSHTAFPGLIHGFFDLGHVSTACQAAISETLNNFRSLLH
jgi:acetyl esterase